MTRYRLGTDTDTGKPCMLVSPDGPWMCAGEVNRVMAALAPTAVVPQIDDYGFYRCHCGHYVGCDGRVNGIKALQKAFCADCGSRMDWTGVEVWQAEGANNVENRRESAEMPPRNDLNPENDNVPVREA